MLRRAVPCCLVPFLSLPRPLLSRPLLRCSLSTGHFHTPDMLTIGQGAQSQAQYRSQMLLWAVRSGRAPCSAVPQSYHVHCVAARGVQILAAPLILGNDVRTIDNFTLALVTSPEVLLVDQDPDCIQGSLARALGATETWIKPLHDGTFAVVLVSAASVSIVWM